MSNKPEVHEQYYRANDVADRLVWESKRCSAESGVSFFEGQVVLNGVYVAILGLSGSPLVEVAAFGFVPIILGVVFHIADRERNNRKLPALTSVVIEEPTK